MTPPRYPRDMIGYGANPPDPQWPDGAKIAVQIVLNSEEGGENATIHGDAGSEAFLSEIVGAASWEGKRHANMESIYEYGARAGFWRLHRLFTGMDIPLTVYGVATALARSPEQVEAMKAADWEIASHGLKWIEYKDFSRKDERKHMDEAIALHTEEVGELAGELRERDRDRKNLEEEFADVLAWLATIANVVDIDLTQAITNKYGTGCPGCQQWICICPDEGKP